MLQQIIILATKNSCLNAGKFFWSSRRCSSAGKIQPVLFRSSRWHVNIHISKMIIILATHLILLLENEDNGAPDNSDCHAN